MFLLSFDILFHLPKLFPLLLLLFFFFGEVFCMLYLLNWMGWVTPVF